MERSCAGQAGTTVCVDILQGFVRGGRLDLELGSIQVPEFFRMYTRRCRMTLKPMRELHVDMMIGAYCHAVIQETVCWWWYHVIQSQMRVVSFFCIWWFLSCPVLIFSQTPLLNMLSGICFPRANAFEPGALSWDSRFGLSRKDAPSGDCCRLSALLVPLRW
ncbi:unnamed protein product [Hapterophycus canaliculatus]